MAKMSGILLIIAGIIIANRGWGSVLTSIKGKLAALRIPFNRPFFSGKEFDFIQEAIANWQLSGDGAFTKKCHSLLEKELGIPKALLTTSCTHALEMAALLLDIKPGDEVIAPSFTFVSTVNAFVLRGASPVFIDIRPDTLNLDETKLEGLITARTKAILVVHYAGVGCEMNAILQVAGRHGIPWLKIMRMAYSVGLRVTISVRLAVSYAKLSTKPKISPAAKAERF